MVGVDLLDLKEFFEPSAVVTLWLVSLDLFSFSLVISSLESSSAVDLVDALSVRIAVVVLLLVAEVELGDDVVHLLLHSVHALQHSWECPGDSRD